MQFTQQTDGVGRHSQPAEDDPSTFPLHAGISLLDSGYPKKLTPGAHSAACPPDHAPQLPVQPKVWIERGHLELICAYEIPIGKMVTDSVFQPILRSSWLGSVLILLIALSNTTNRWLSKSPRSPVPLYEATASPCVARESQVAGSETHILCISNLSCQRARPSKLQHVETSSLPGADSLKQ